MSALLHELLEESARRRPHAPAFSLDQNQLTFDELDRAANRFAHLLRHAGIRAGDRVGIHLDKSLEAVSAVFGTLKAGAAYVPLDPAAPPRRVSGIITDCGLKAVIGPAPGPRDPGIPDENTIRIDPLAPETPPETGGPVFTARDLAGQPDAPPPPPGTAPDSLAYILYTSGSTGTPKGVMISHRAALAFVHWAVNSFRLMEHDRLAAQAPLIFDLSIFDLFAGVLAGAHVVLVPRAVSAFPMNLSSFIESRHITCWYSVPSTLTRVLLEGGLETRDLSALRTVLFAGEVFPVKYLRQWMRLVPGASYYNLYGPTETNVCTYHAVTAPPASGATALPIGRPCAGAEILLLNSGAEPVAPGEIGEVYVRGPGVLQGYWNRPEWTREVLRELPDGQGPAYRTGDLARLGDDGEYYFQGRDDLMIKSRGYRIEPGEVEATLDAHPKVVQSVVVALPDERLGGRLKAFVVLRGPLSDADLTRHCGERLPAYMTPALFERLDDLPRTPTGKIDRAALRGNGTGTPAPAAASTGEVL